MQQTLRQLLSAFCAFQLESIPTTVAVVQRLVQRYLPKYLVVILFATSWPILVTAQSGTIPKPNNRSVLLLRNGQTFTGALTKSTSIQAYYTLIDDLGNQLRFPKSQVEFVSDSLLEIYAYRRATQIRNNAPACLALAQWCMQLQLFDQAQEQIDNATTISGRSSSIARLEIRLDLLRSPPASLTVHSIDRAASTTIVSAEEVQHRIDQFRSSVVQQFIGSVQPLLLNHCALAGCHGPSPKSTYVLFRTSAKRIIPRRITQRNLYNTLTTLDLDHPENSSLLTSATTAHGMQPAPALDISATQQIAALVNWVRIVAATPTHHADSNVTNPNIASRPIMYQQGRSQRTEKMTTPDSDPPLPSLNPPILPLKFQPWVQSPQRQPTRSTLGLGVALPVEMQGPTLGIMKIAPPKRVNLTPNLGGSFSLPSQRFLLQNP